VLTKIVPNMLTRNTPDLLAALSGRWGRKEEKLFLGRLNVEFIYSGKVVRNEGGRKAIAILVFEDDTWDIISVGAITSVEVAKEIKTGIVVEQE
jgi:hypothetical protein